MGSVANPSSAQDDLVAFFWMLDSPQIRGVYQPRLLGHSIAAQVAPEVGLDKYANGHSKMNGGICLFVQRPLKVNFSYTESVCG